MGAVDLPCADRAHLRSRPARIVRDKLAADQPAVVHARAGEGYSHQRGARPLQESECRRDHVRRRLGLALWSASGYVAAFMRAANAIWDAPEGRPIWKTLPVRVGVTIVTVVVLAIGAVAVVVTGPIRAAGRRPAGIAQYGRDCVGHR